MFDDLINKTTDFLYTHLNNADVSLKEKKYRYEHSLRVTHIGLDLAKNLDANLKITLLACLLHDVGKFDALDDKEHGRVSAEVANTFLQTLDLSKKELADIHYCIAIHADNDAGYEYEDIIEAKIVSDADNIDRFGAYRIKGMMQHFQSLDKSLEDHIEHIGNVIKQYKHYQENQVMKTKPGNERFNKQLALGINYFINYYQQLKITNTNFNLDYN